MRKRSRGKRLDGNTGILKRPRISETFHNHVGGVGSAIGMEEATLGFENLLGTGPTECGKIRRHDATLGRVPSLKWLHHRAKVLSEPGRLARGDGESACRVNCIQTLEPRARRRSAKDAASPRGMKTILVVAR